MRLRKWLRFTKCGTCEKHRAIRFDRKSSREAKEDSTRTLIAHYKWVKAERAYAHSKKVTAKQDPTKLLSIAIDGTDQLKDGLPQFQQATSAGVFHVFIFTHIMVSIVISSIFISVVLPRWTCAPPRACQVHAGADS